MDKKRVLKYLAAVLAIAGIVLVVLVISGDRRQADKTGRRFALPGTGRDTREVYLYFAAGQGESLVAEKHRIKGADDPAEVGCRILRALINGPVNRELSPTMPGGTTCRAFYVMPDGVAYADFSGALKDNHPGGSEAERITIYSIVNSLALNIDEIQTVKILIEGREEKTMAGHIDLRRPFEADIRIIQ